MARASDIPEGEGRGFEVGDRTIGVFRCGDRLLAVEDVCTHAFALLHEGSVDRIRCTVECPLHGAEFDLASGAALTPPAPEPVPVFPVRVVGDDVEVGLPDGE